MAIPFKVSAPRVYGKITDISEIEGEFGPQIQITLQPADPEAIAERRWWFKPSEADNSKWVHFWKSFSESRAKVVQGAGDVQSEQEMLNAFICVEEGTRSGIISGEKREWREPKVAEYYTSEEDMVEAWRVATGTKTTTEAPTTPQPTPQTPPTQTAPVTTIPAQVVPVLKSMWDKAGGNPVAYWKSVGNFNYSMESVLAAVGSSLKAYVDELSKQGKG